MNNVITCPACSSTVKILKNGTIPRHGHRGGAGCGGGGCMAWGFKPGAELDAAIDRRRERSGAPGL